MEPRARDSSSVLLTASSGLILISSIYTAPSNRPYARAVLKHHDRAVLGDR